MTGRPPELVSSLLAEIEVHMRVSVTDEGSRRRPPPREGGGRCFRGFVWTTPTDGPPVATYLPALRPRPGLVVLAGGDRPVFFDRVVVKPGEYARSSPAYVPARIERRTEAIAHLEVIVDQSLDFLRDESLELVFSDNGQLIRELRSLRQHYVRGWDQLSTLLRKRGLSPGHLAPAATAEVIDLRKDVSVGLPSNEELGLGRKGELLGGARTFR